MFTSFLLFLLFLFLFGIILAVLTLCNLYYRSGLDQVFSLFRKQQDPGKQKNSTSSKHRGGRNRHTKTDSGDILIDTRDPEKANQKIFADNEGEYVDFNE